MSSRFNFRTFRWTQTMLFAIDEINKRDDLLPDTDLGYVIYDSCFTISKAVEGTLTYLTGQDEAVPNYRCGNGPPLAALVGAGGSDLSIATARILGLYHFPQVGWCIAVVRISKENSKSVCFLCSVTIRSAILQLALPWKVSSSFPPS